jgi:hypothetical protein
MSSRLASIISDIYPMSRFSRRTSHYVIAELVARDAPGRMTALLETHGVAVKDGTTVA